MIYKKIYLSVFGVVIHYFRGERQECNDLFLKKFPGSDDLAIGTHQGRCYDMWNNGIQTGDFCFWTHPYASVGTLAHESVHVADRIMQFIGAHDIELRGYLTGWIVDRITGIKTQ